jgi:hypothetical protein
MMKCEFEERTGYWPDDEEYHYIEESYYEFDGNKDEFCKAWLKDRKDGHWEKELKLRKAADEIKTTMQAVIDEKEKDLEWYRAEWQKGWEAQKELKLAQEKLERLERVFKRVYEIT